MKIWIKKLLPVLSRQLIPNLGTVLAVIALLFAYNAWAAPGTPPENDIDSNAAPAAQGATPGTLSYQGYLTNAAGQPANDTLNITFRIYNVPTGGTALWTETRSGSNAVPVSDGLFNVHLGSITPIPASMWNNATLYLGIQVGGDAEMSPREVLGAVPVAIAANQATSDFFVPGSLNVQNGASIISAWPGPSLGAGPDLGEYTIGVEASPLYQVIGAQASPQSTPGKPVTGAAGFGIVSGNHQVSPVVWLFGWGDRNEFRVIRRGWATDISSDPVLFAVDASGNGRFLGSISHGASIENNLQTPDELASSRISRFSQGDLLCWDVQTERLEMCASAATFLVQAVADENGKPIVMGAEPVKVIGPVQTGDLLVTSDKPGYAVAWRSTERPPAGAVIAQALEAFEGERGLVKAMIRKF